MAIGCDETEYPSLPNATLQLKAAQGLSSDLLCKCLLCLLYVAIVSSLFPLLGLYLHRLLAGERLPTGDGHVYVLRINLDPVARPASSFAGD